MVSRMLKATLFCLTCLLPVLATAQDQELEVSVDRTELARGETLTLTVRVFDQRNGMQLDLTPLTDDFDVLGTRTSSQIRSINGRTESWTDYTVTLFPLNEGDLTIPALSINNLQTDPIEISVVNQGPRSNQSSDDLFLEIDVNKESVYVQEQLLFSVRLYYTINGIRNPQFTELEMPDSVIQLIGSPNQYERLIDGVRYGVYEKRYVIFPQRSGPLEIPDILFRGEVTDGTSNFVFRNLNTRRVTAFIDGITIDVKERPAAAQELDFWLPVTSLTLTEEWRDDLTDLQVGDSLERTVTMRAEGLDGAVLPPFADGRIQGLNLYPNPPEIDRTFIDGRIVGSREESMTLVPTQAGDIAIPEIAIPWWNVETDQLETAIIPATTIQVAAVAGAVPSEQSVASTQNLADLLESGPVIDQDMIDAQAEAETIEVGAIWLNLVIAAAITIALLVIYKATIAPQHGLIRQTTGRWSKNFQDHYEPENNESVAYGDLVKACRARDIKKVRSAFIIWSSHFIKERPVRSMEDILQQQETPELHRYAAGIQNYLFNNESADTGFQPEELLAAAKSLRSKNRQARKQQARQDKYALPPLYKI